MVMNVLQMRIVSRALFYVPSSSNAFLVSMKANCTLNCTLHIFILFLRRIWINQNIFTFKQRLVVFFRFPFLLER